GSARLTRTLGHDRFQRLHEVAVREGKRVHLAVAPDRNLEARCQRIGNRDADAVQPAGERVSTAGTLVELAASMQPREDNFDDRLLFFGMQPYRNAAAVVFD